MHAAHRSDLRRQAKEQPSRRSATSSDGGATADMCTRALRLPIEEREVLMLVAVERLSYADIASLLGVPIATVMSTLSRARARLADSSRMP
jgi:RNA polymerase sigma-70 factor (ECF subfamily)